MLPATDYLVDDYAARFGRRVRIARWGSVRTSADGENLDDGESAPADPAVDEHVVVFDRGDRVRIVDDDGVRRLLVWVDRSDMARVPTVAAALDVEPNDGPANGAGITLLPGVPVVLGAVQAGFVHVAHANDVFELEGWLPESKIEYVYTPKPVKVPALDHVIARAVELLDGPGGRSLGRFLADVYDEPVRVLGTREGHTEIVYFADGFFARGFVVSDAVDGTDSVSALQSLGPLGTAGVFGISERVRVTLPAGTCLYDGDDAPIGVVVNETTSFGGRTSDDAVWYAAVSTNWGFFDIHLRLPDGAQMTDDVPSTWRTCDE